MADDRVGVVVPCFNEAARLDLERFAELAREPNLLVRFVDDGSADDTARRLAAWTSGVPSASLLSLPSNVGKAEAVRAGLSSFVADGLPYVAYFDADLASPPSELVRLIQIARTSPDHDVVLGARVALLGADIARNRSRHYQGRVFATLASIILALPVYDTQCGLKIFRVTPALRSALTSPMPSRWLLDVELLARILSSSGGASSPDRIVEVPLAQWRDVGGSKVDLRAKTRVLVDLARFAWRHRALRQQHAVAPR